MATKKNDSTKASTHTKKSSSKKKVVKGSHLTVTTWPCGHIQLKWDDDALLREVREATK